MAHLNSQDQIKFDNRLFDAFAGLDNRWKEAELFFSGRKGRAWRERYQAWELHLHEYGGRKKPPAGPGAWETTRIDKLNDFLTILDQKIGMALAFNALLLTVATIFLAWIPTVAEEFKCARRECFSDALYALTFATLFVLLFGLCVLLLGYRRVVWGDLGRSGKNDSDEKDSDEKEKEYAGFLIMSVARRTNQFRISTYISAVALVLLVALVSIGALFVIANHRCAGESKAKREAGSSSRPTGKISVENNSGIVQFGGVASSLSVGNNPTDASVAAGKTPTCVCARAGGPRKTSKQPASGCPQETSAQKP